MVYSPFKQAGASSQLVPVCLPEDDEYQANFNILTQISHRTSQLMTKFPLPHGTTASSLPILMQSIGAILLSTSDQDAKSQINMITLCCDEVAAARLADSTSPPQQSHPVQGELDKTVNTILDLEAEDHTLEQCLTDGKDVKGIKIDADGKAVLSARRGEIVNLLATAIETRSKLEKKLTAPRSAATILLDQQAAGAMANIDPRVVYIAQLGTALSQLIRGWLGPSRLVHIESGGCEFDKLSLYEQIVHLRTFNSEVSCATLQHIHQLAKLQALSFGSSDGTTWTQHVSAVINSIDLIFAESAQLKGIAAFNLYHKYATIVRVCYSVQGDDKQRVFRKVIQEVEKEYEAKFDNQHLPEMLQALKSRLFDAAKLLGQESEPVTKKNLAAWNRTSNHKGNRKQNDSAKPKASSTPPPEPGSAKPNHCAKCGANDSNNKNLFHTSKNCHHPPDVAATLLRSFKHWCNKRHLVDSPGKGKAYSATEVEIKADPKPKNGKTKVKLNRDQLQQVQAALESNPDSSTVTLLVKSSNSYSQSLSRAHLVASALDSNPRFTALRAHCNRTNQPMGILDSGCTRAITGNATVLANLRPTPVALRTQTASGEIVVDTHGDFQLCTPAHHPQHPATLVLNGEAGYHESIPSDLILLPENALSRLDIDTVKLAPQSPLMDHLTSVITEQLTDAGFDRNSPRQLLRLPTSHVAVAVLLDQELGLWGLPLLLATDHVDANELDSTASAHREWQSLAWHLCHFPSDQSILVAHQALSPPINVSADCSHPCARNTNDGTVPLTPAPHGTAGDRVFVSTTQSKISAVDIAVLLGAPSHRTLDKLCKQLSVHLSSSTRRAANKLVNARKLAVKKARFKRRANPNTPIYQRGQLAIADLGGPFPASISRNRYVLCIADHATAYPVAYPQPTKSSLVTMTNVRHYFTNYNDQVVGCNGAPTGVTLSTDQGGEFAGCVQQYLAETGIRQRAPAAYDYAARSHHEHLVDRIKSKTRCLLILASAVLREINLPAHRVWDHAAQLAALVLSLELRPHQKDLPYELQHHERVTTSTFRRILPAPFMAPAIVKDHTASGLLPKGKVVYYLGYDALNERYKFLDRDTMRVITSSDVSFHVDTRSLVGSAPSPAGVAFVDNSITLTDSVPTLDGHRMIGDALARSSSPTGSPTDDYTDDEDMDAHVMPTEAPPSDSVPLATPVALPAPATPSPTIVTGSSTPVRTPSPDVSLSLDDPPPGTPFDLEFTVDPPASSTPRDDSLDSLHSPPQAGKYDNYDHDTTIDVDMVYPDIAERATTLVSADDSKATSHSAILDFTEYEDMPCLVVDTDDSDDECDDDLIVSLAPAPLATATVTRSSALQLGEATSDSQAPCSASSELGEEITNAERLFSAVKSTLQDAPTTTTRLSNTEPHSTAKSMWAHAISGEQVRDSVLQALQQCPPLEPLSTVADPGVPCPEGKPQQLPRHWDDGVVTAQRILFSFAAMTFEYLLDEESTNLYGLEQDLDEESTADFFAGVEDHQNTVPPPMQRICWCAAAIEADHQFTQADVVLAKREDTGHYELGHSAFVLGDSDRINVEYINPHLLDERTYHDTRLVNVNLDKATALEAAVHHNYVIPNTIAEALTLPEAEQWQEAIDAEVAQCVSYGTWQDATLSQVKRKWPDVQPIGTRMCFKIKFNSDGSIEKFKCRLVALGYREKEGVHYHETYSAIPRSSTFKLVLAASVQQAMQLCQFDIGNAFLESPQDTLVVIRMPLGLRRTDEQGNELYGILLRSIYGLKSAPRNFGKRYVKFMQSVRIDGLSFIQSQHDPTLWILRRKLARRPDRPDDTRQWEVLSYINGWVDDILGAFANDAIREQFATQFKREWKRTTGGGAISWYLNCDVKYNLSSGILTMNQRQKIEQIVKLVFGEVEIDAQVDTPAVVNQKLLPTEESDELSPEETSTYRSAVGACMWVYIITRSDIGFALIGLTRFLANPGRQHMNALRRLVKWLHCTKDQCLTFERNSTNDCIHGPGTDPLELTASSDCGFASNHDLTSNGAYIVMLGGAPIAVKTWILKFHLWSAHEGETCVASECAREVIHQRSMCSEMGFTQRGPTPIYCDNAQTVIHAQEVRVTDKSKHIRLRDWYIRDQKLAGNVLCLKAKGTELIIDALTKQLPHAQHRRHYRKLLGDRSSVSTSGVSR